VMEGSLPVACWRGEEERLSLVGRLERIGCSVRTDRKPVFEGEGEACYVWVEGRPGGCRLQELVKSI